MTHSVKDYWQGDLNTALDHSMAWMLSRQNANVSPFIGNAVLTPTTPVLVEGIVNLAEGSLSSLVQDPAPGITFDAQAGQTADDQPGLDGLPINDFTFPSLTRGQLINVLLLAGVSDVSGRVFDLTEAADQYRVDVYSCTDVLYYQGSSAIALDNTWQVAAASPGTVVAYLMPVASPEPEVGSWTSSVTDWIAHTNLGVGNRLRDYFARIYVKTDMEYLQEDNVPLTLIGSNRARYGSSKPVAGGMPVVHVIRNDPQLGSVDLYSSLQNQAVYSDLPRSIEVPPGDPDFAGPGLMVGSNAAYLQNRCWIYDAALAIIAFTVAGLWDAAKRIVVRLNALREHPGYLPSTVLESAEDGSTARWAITSGIGTTTNIFDASEPPAQSEGSRVIAFTANSATTYWNFVGTGLPNTSDTIVDWRFKTSLAFRFFTGIATSTGKVTSVEFVSAGTPGFDPGAKKITVPVSWEPGHWRVVNQNLEDLINQYVSGEELASITSFQVEILEPGELRLDNLSLGTPQPSGSLSFSYDVYNGQVDQAYIRTGAMAWVGYAYGIYMERTADFQTAALGLESMLQFLFSLQSTAADARQNLILGGWGKYQDPGYQYIPGQLAWVSTEHNIDCYFAFEKAARVLPTAAQNLYQRNLITRTQCLSLTSAASAATQKANQIKAALLNQLWIPASGNMKGHFAQGADPAGLDTSLALDAAGAWAAMFCHDVGEDTKAVESLEFIYETFFSANRQILKSSEPSSFNQTYELLTPFDGLKPYADSPGGYSGSPEAVWMEGTWGALAAFLRLADDATLRDYLSANYPGGTEAFLSRLVKSMQTAGSTTSHRGLLSFSLAARPLPWEFSVRKMLASTVWFWLTATRNDVLLSTIEEGLRGQPYLKVPQGVHQSIQQLEGRTSIGALELETTTGGGYLDALVSGGKLEGRKLTLKVGYPDLLSSEFVTVATQQIESVQSAPNSSGYVLQCRDLQRSAKTKIFTRGDDGVSTSRDHPRHLLANPLDIVLIVLQNELGLGQNSSLPESSWKLYDPAQWDAAGETNSTLIDPNPFVDAERLLFYRNGVFAGYLLEFEFQQPVEAKQFLEYEVYRALGGYQLVLPDGRLSPHFFLPPLTFESLFELNETNMTVIPGVERHPIINQVTYRMDYDGSGFQKEFLFLCGPSLEKYGLAGQHTIESKGLRTGRGGASLAGLTATRIFRRYAGLDPVSGAGNGGAPILNVDSQFLTMTVEPGDCVLASHPLAPNFETGTRGVYNRLCEVIEKQPDFAEGRMSYRLLDSAWVRTKKLSRIAPEGTPAYSAATSAQQARYMYIASDDTETYSDGTTGKTIF